jgi:2-haloalkanoic acid dehalogenase type II
MLSICFDLDGTLCDAVTAEEAAWVEVVKRIASEGVEPDRAAQTFKEHFDRYEEVYAELVLKNGLGEKQIRRRQIADTLSALGLEKPRLVEELSTAHWATMSRCYRLYPEAAEVLRKLGSMYRLSLLSNGPSDLQREKIRVLGVESHFDHIVISGEVGYFKPSREIFMCMVGVLGAEPHEVMYIGDNYEKDMLGALGAGLRAIWVNRSDKVQPIHDQKPECTVRDLSELLRALE